MEDPRPRDPDPDPDSDHICICICICIYIYFDARTTPCLLYSLLLGAGRMTIDSITVPFCIVSLGRGSSGRSIASWRWQDEGARGTPSSVGEG